MIHARLLIAIATSLILFLKPEIVQATCEKLQADISRKIIANGVPESDFRLMIVSNDQLSKVVGKVVGHCENNTKKIIYVRYLSSSSHK